MKVAWYWLIRSLARYGFFVLSGGFRVVGKENVPLSGPIIVAPNHSSYLDPPAIACALPRQVAFMSKEELFRNKLFGCLIRSLGAFPVRRGTSDLEAIRISQQILESGKALLMFPEGTRNDGETMLPINRGVELLAKKGAALVVPAGIIGTHRKWGKGGRRKLFCRVTVSFGEPINVLDYAHTKEAFSRELAQRISALCQESGFDLKTAFEEKPIAALCGADEANGPPHPESL